MNCLGIDPDRAADALARLQIHVPLNVEIGRIRVAAPAEDSTAFISDTGEMWWSHHGHATRCSETSDTHVEVVEWAWRIETARNVTMIG